MKLTIAFDDISLPLPPMERARHPPAGHRGVLDLAADAGVDDVVLIAALALHRRMTEAELRHAVGDRVYDAFAPHGLLYTARRRGPRRPRPSSGTTDQGEEVEINKRAAESDLLVYVNINLVAMDGGHKSVGHRPGQLPQPAPPPQRRRPCSTRRSFMDQHRSELHSSNWRMGKAHRRQPGVKVFQIETTLNNDTFPVQLRLPAEARVGVDGARPARLPGRLKAALDRTPARAGAARSSSRSKAPHR